MDKVKVAFSNIYSALDFVNRVEHIDVDLYFVGPDKYISAHSFLGICSILFEQPLELEIKGNSSIIEKTKSEIRDYIVA